MSIYNTSEHKNKSYVALNVANVSAINAINAALFDLLLFIFIYPAAIKSTFLGVRLLNRNKLIYKKHNTLHKLCFDCLSFIKHKQSKYNVPILCIQTQTIEINSL